MGTPRNNPLAQYREAISVEQVLAAPPISYPLTLPMCSPVSDGAAAAIVCNESASSACKAMPAVPCACWPACCRPAASARRTTSKTTWCVVPPTGSTNNPACRPKTWGWPRCRRHGHWRSLAVRTAGPSSHGTRRARRPNAARRARVDASPSTPQEGSKAKATRLVLPGWARCLSW